MPEQRERLTFSPMHNTIFIQNVDLVEVPLLTASFLFLPDIHEVGNMQQATAVTYVLLLSASLSSNKFVLSGLGFQFPMVFQGWQTLVGFLIYRLLHATGKLNITQLDTAGYISLFPFFLFFCSSILTGALAKLCFSSMQVYCSLC